jgi:hypothetical protein
MADAQPRNTPGASLVLHRRALLRAAAAIGAGGVFGARALAAAPAAFPEGGTLLVGGPDGGTLSLLADRLIAALLAGQPGGMALHSKPVGGADGVTGANQFEARVAPDGQTALLVSGAAAMAWLVGDPRAQYDVARWLPLMAGITPGLVCSRLPLASLRPGAELRMAASGPVGPDLPALLAVELLGLRLAPVFGMQDHKVAAQALQAGAVDAVFLHGPNARAHAADLAAVGAPPLFAMGSPDETGELRRDPVLPALPTMPELAVRLRGAAPAGQLYAAWQACAAAADLQFALVVPVLTPAAMVSLWRKAAMQMAASSETPASDVRTLPAPGANNVLSVISAEAPTLLALRRWLAERLNWHPA